MTKWTPGPWDNRKWNSEEHQISAKGGTVALVSHSHSLINEDEADANARLIAASPRLHACLQGLMTCVAELLIDEAITFDEETDEAALRMIVDEARAALARVDGGGE